MGLKEYHRKRNFGETPEPRGKIDKTATGSRFVIQKHDASHLHYDFRLELDGVLKSWAVPKGPSLDPGQKRLAVQVEDHPIDYGDFEGIIPSGYGKGTVLLWDRGKWFPEGDPADGLRLGKLKFRLEGEKLRGGWTLVRMGGRASEQSKPQWLLIKEKDDEMRAIKKGDILTERPESVASGRDLNEITEQKDAVWESNGKSKKEKPKATRPISPSKRKGRKAVRISTAIDPSSLDGARKVPIPSSVKVQLATLVDDSPKGEDWLHEIKYDGYRLICRIDKGRVKLITRNGKDWTDRFSTLARIGAELPVKQAILDGEIVSMLPNGVTDFQSLQNAIHEGQESGLVYFAFDLLYLDGYDLQAVPLSQRKELLSRILQGNASSAKAIRYSKHIEGKGEQFYQHACRLGLEGIISKRADQPYRSGRTRTWLKTKCAQRQEFVIGGFTDPQGSRAGFGALLLGYYEDGKLQYAGRVGTGFNSESLKELYAKFRKIEQKSSSFAKGLTGIARRGVVHFIKPALVAEVGFIGWTRDGILRHPTFEGLREDKPAASIVRERPADTTKVVKEDPKSNGRARRASVEISGEEEILGVRLTHPDRVLYAEQGITKRDLAKYYEKVAKWMMPYVIDRPLTLVRCPQGQGKACFYQRHLEKDLSDTFGEVFVQGKTERESYQYIKSPAALISLVQRGALEIHVWGSRADQVDRPDQMIFDLDPGPGVEWKQIVQGAHQMRELLSGLGLESFAKLSGGKGIHVVVPLARKHEWDEVKSFSKAVALKMTGLLPGKYTAKMTKAKRGGKIFIDYLRNAREATSIAPYSTRARPGAAVAIPIGWDELTPKTRPSDFTIQNVPDLLASRKKNPWARFPKLHQSITAKMKKTVG